MTETTERTSIDEALAVIDRALQSVSGRELVSSAEVADMLLDLRTALTSTQN